MSAILSDCGTFRYRLEREVGMIGPVYAYFGVNCSTADHQVDDNTVARWIGFTKLYGGGKFVVGNPFVALCFSSQHPCDMYLRTKKWTDRLAASAIATLGLRLILIANKTGL
jgi:hypothetical protein